MELNNDNALGFSDGADEAQGQAVADPQADGMSETAGAATPQPDADTTDGDAQGAAAPEGTETEAEQDAPPIPGSREWNNAMKQARVAGKFEAEKAINDAYTKRLADAGVLNPLTNKPFTNLDEFAEYSDAVAANAAGVSLEQFRAQREEQERLQKAKIELDAVKTELAQVKISGEFAELKKQFPEIKAKSVQDLGEDFIRLRASGVAPDVAYMAVRDAKAARMKEPPKSMGALSRQGAERDYFSSDELDMLTAEQLKDPAILAKAMKSMERLGKN